MDRRAFLKSVPALAVLASAQPSFSRNIASDSMGKVKTAVSSYELQKAVEQGDVIKLNPPNLSKKTPLMTALKKRKTHRNISDKKLSLQQLSEVLWAADGVNRPDGKRTSPAAMAKYAVDIYVVLPEGVYLYDVAKHELKPIAKGDYRKQAGRQDFVYTAPLNLVYVINLKNWENLKRPVPRKKRDRWIILEAGFFVQNVYLYCASEGLGTVVRGYIDEDKFSKVIRVKPERVILAQTVGHLK